MTKVNIFVTLVTLLLIVECANASQVKSETAKSMSLISQSDRAVILSTDATELHTAIAGIGDNIFELKLLEGEGMLLEPGMPVLPSVTRFVVVPHEAGLDFKYEVIGTNRSNATSAIPVFNPDLEEQYQPLDVETFRHVGLYPPEAAVMSEPIVMRGVRMVSITTYPVQYDPHTEEYIHNPHIETEIVLTNEEPVNPGANPILRNRSKQFLKVIQDMAINGDIVGRDDPDRDAEPEYVGHYLIVIHENCLQYAAPFIEWRRKSGWKVDIYSVRGNDGWNPDRIKTNIRERYNAYLEDGIDPFDHLLIIGDRTSYHFSQASQFIIDSFTGTNPWNGGVRYADYLYACMDGDNDHVPDMGFSRWHTGAQNLMELTVAKTLAYEANPFMEDTDWFTNAGTFSQHWGNSIYQYWHPSFMTSTRWAHEALRKLGFTDVLFYESSNFDRNGTEIGPVMRDLINSKVNLIIGRFENYYWRQNLNGLENNNVFPIIFSSGGYGQWNAESLTRTGDRNNLKGAVAITYGYGETHYALPLSAAWLETTNGFINKGLTFGWARAMGIQNYLQYFGNIQQANHIKTSFDSFGDPGIRPWIGVPRTITVSHQAIANMDTKYLEVSVLDEFEENPVIGAQVSVYAPGNMPEFDQEEYGSYIDLKMQTVLSDENGIARFVFDEEHQFEGEVIYVTVTGDDIKPHFSEMTIGAVGATIVIDEFYFEQANGNNDENLNPGERFTLSLTAKNISHDSNADNVRARVVSLSPFISVADNEINFDDIGAGEASVGAGSIEYSIAPNCPDSKARPKFIPTLRIEFRSDNGFWYSAIKLDVKAPHLILERIIDGNIVLLEERDMNVEVRNVGRVAMPASEALFSASGLGVNAIRDLADYNAIDIGQVARINGNPFSVMGSIDVVPGSLNSAYILFSTENGFKDTIHFDIQVGIQSENAPYGPDEYGYIVYDDTDGDWDEAPVYEWVEISLREEERDFDGTLVEFEGEYPFDVGEAIVVPFDGFVTGYYGELVDAITICNNGFIVVGEQPKATNFQNWPLDRGFGAGAGIIAPFWNDLRLGNTGQVYYYHDQELNRFIVQWDQMQFATQDNERLTFQLILFDSRHWGENANNSQIVFQYKSIANIQNIREGIRRQYNAWIDDPTFASVGISSPDGTTGVNYTYNNQYNIANAPLENERALKFVSKIQMGTGILDGYVFDYETEQPIENAIVLTDYGYFARTNADGYFAIENALNGIVFSLTAKAQGYNDSTLVELEIEQDDGLSVNFSLLHPLFTPSTRQIQASLELRLEAESDFRLENRGNGLLNWTLEKRVLSDFNFDPWEFRSEIVTSAVLEDPTVFGVVDVNQHFYVAGNAVGDKLIYVLNREGDLIRSFLQPENNGFNGITDLTWDGEYLYGIGGDEVIAFTTEGEEQFRFNAPFYSTSYISYDSNRDAFWCGSVTTDFILIDRDFNGDIGNAIARHSRDGIRVYGIANWEYDPDGYNVYFTGKLDNIITVYKMHPETGEKIALKELPTREGRGGNVSGLHITNEIDIYSWVMIAGINNGALDRIDMWQLESKRDWFMLSILNENNDLVEARAGTIDAGEHQEFELKLNTRGLEPNLYEGELLFTHNSDIGMASIPVSLEVTAGMMPNPFNLALPMNGDTLNLHPALIVDFHWERCFDPNYDGEAVYSLWFEFLGDTLRLNEINDTTMRVSFMELGLTEEDLNQSSLTWGVVARSNAFYFYSEESWELHFLGLFAGNREELIPVEFALREIYPNPFNSTLAITFGADRHERTSLKLYDIMGREVATLYNGVPEIGWHKIGWNATNLSSGIYFVRLQSSGREKYSKVILLR